MIREGQPSGWQPKTKLFREMIHNPGDAKRLWSERTHGIDQTPIGNRLIADVFVEPAKAQSILTKRAKTGLSPIIPHTRRVDDETPTQTDEITVFPKAKSQKRRGEPVVSDDDMAAFYDRDNGQTFGGIVDRVITSSLRYTDPANQEKMLQESIVLFGDIFAILALVDKKKVGFDDAASAVVHSLSNHPFGHFSFGEAIESIKDGEALSAIRTDARTASKFEEVYLREANEEQRVQFVNGTLSGQIYWLTNGSYRAVIERSEDDAYYNLAQRRKRVIRENAKSKEAKTLPILQQDDPQRNKLRRKMTRHFYSRGGLELSHEDVSAIYADRNTPFTGLIDSTINGALINISHQQNPDAIAEYMRMFGRFFDQLSILQPGVINFDAGVASILHRLYAYNFNTALIGETISHIMHLQYPTGEFYETGDRASAQQFIDVFFKIMPKEERDAFSTIISNTQYNNRRSINITRRAAKQYNIPVGDQPFEYPGESVN